MSETLHPPIWVDKPNKLEKMIAEISAHKRIAVDTESNSLHAFREQVCLMQFSIPEKDYLVDPLALQDMSSLAPVFENPKIEKIFHAAEYDLICLRRDFGYSFSNLFDTMQAARVLGYQAVGLDRLLGDKFGITMDKRHQKADWGARPLKPDQIHYARLDTHYLFDLRDVLEQELREKNRWEFAMEDFVIACEVDLPNGKENGSSWKRFSARKDVNLRELTILKELCIVRDAIAEKLNRPSFKVMDNDTLLEIARTQSQAKEDLSAVGLSDKQIRLWGGEILEAVKRGVDAPPVKREQAKRPNDAMLKRLEKLKNWRKKTAGEMKVESDIVLPKFYMFEIAEHPPKNLSELEKIMAGSPTRFACYGVHIIGALGGNHAN